MHMVRVTSLFRLHNFLQFRNHHFATGSVVVYDDSIPNCLPSSVSIERCESDYKLPMTFDLFGLGGRYPPRESLTAPLGPTGRKTQQLFKNGVIAELLKVNVGFHLPKGANTLRTLLTFTC